MKFIASLIVAALLVVLVPSMGSATTGVEHAGGCVTREEYRAIAEGMPRVEAERILDGGGHNAALGIFPRTLQFRRYRGCGGTFASSQVFVRYGKADRVVFSYWYLPCMRNCVTEVE